MASFQRGCSPRLGPRPASLIGESIGDGPTRQGFSLKTGGSDRPGSPDDGSPTMSIFRRTSWRAAMAGVSRWLAGASYLQKWLVLGVLIGAMAGVGAIVFYEALLAATHLFLGVLAGYHVPDPGRRGRTQRPRPRSPGPGRCPWSSASGRCSAPSSSSGSPPRPRATAPTPPSRPSTTTRRGIRFRTVIVKIVASALTIGSGGSGGREGPTGQISAGFGSLLARELDLSPADARIAVVDRDRLGYRGHLRRAARRGGAGHRDPLPRRLRRSKRSSPASSPRSSATSSSAPPIGFTPLFGFNGSYHFTDPAHLLWFALIGVLGGLIGLLYAKGFYGIAAVFEPPAAAPVGEAGHRRACWWAAIALAIPEVLGTGYGWIQQSLGHQLLHLPLWIVLILPFARIVATGLSIGSGGSGGIFGPGHGHRRLHRRLGVAAVRADRPLHGPQPGPLRDRGHDVLLREHLPGAAGRDADGGRDDRQPLDPGPGHDRRRAWPGSSSGGATTPSTAAS